MGDELLVTIEGTVYSAAKLPPSDSQLVASSRAKLLGGVDLEQLRQDVGSVSESFRAAYEGGLVAGPKHVKLQMEVKDLGFYVLKVLDKSVTACSRCKRVYTTIESINETLYDCLMDGFEDVVLEMLVEVPTIGKEMAAMAEEVSRNFEDAALKVKPVCLSVQRAGTEAQALFASHSLHMSVGFMMQVYFLWKHVQEHCQALIEWKIVPTIEKAITYFDSAKRQRMWRATSFKRRTLSYFSDWVAFGGVCEDLLQIMEEAQRNLYECIMKNLSCKDAETCMKQLKIEIALRSNF